MSYRTRYAVCQPEGGQAFGRRDFLRVSAGAAAGLLAASGCTSTRKDTRPNVLLITLDTTRRDHLSCYGCPHPLTPNLDALARESVLYTEAYSDSSWTLPAHASLFTGKAVSSHGSRFDPEGELALADGIDGPEGWEDYRARGLSRDEVTLAGILREAGYATAGVAGGPWLKKVFGLDRGFEFYNDDDIDEVQGRPAPKVTECALRWLGEPRDRPFFLFLNYFDVHDPYIMPNKFLREFFKRHPDKKVFKTEWQTDASLEDNALYAAEVAYMDEFIGALVRNLKALEVYDNTMIVVTSDHGELLGEHDLHGHGVFLFQEEIHVPLFVKYPAGEVPPSHSAQPAQLSDVMAMVLHRVDIAMPADTQGTFSDEAGNPVVSEVYPLPLFYQHGVSQSLWEGGAKYIRNSKGHSAFFDLSENPHEMRNLLSKFPDRVEAMEQKLDAYLAALPEPGAPSPARGIDSETKEAIKGLGYM